MKKILALALSAVLMTSVLTGCSGDSGSEITLYDGINSEMQLIHKMVELVVEDKTDVEVTIKDQMSAVNMFRELTREDPSCDIMNSYDGTVLTTFLKQDPSDVPEGQTLYEYAKAQVMEQYGVDMLDQLGINNTYCIAVPQSIADQYGLETISDLIPVAGELRFGAEHEFFTEEGTMKYTPFTQFYGLNFKEKIPVDINLKYAAVETATLMSQWFIPPMASTGRPTSRSWRTIRTSSRNTTALCWYGKACMMSWQMRLPTSRTY